MVSLEKTSSPTTGPSPIDVKHGQVSEPISSDEGNDLYSLGALGYKPELRRNRSMFTLLFQSLAIAAVRRPLACVHTCLNVLTSIDTLWFRGTSY
jgi:hypothetical protein